jgi:serralysin
MPQRLYPQERTMSFHTYTLNELYSNADGTVQFIELTNGSANGQSFWLGHDITVTQGGVVHRFAFPNNLPNTGTANTKVLVATQAFADLNIVKPDFIVPANFLFTSGAATVNFGGVNALSYTSLPLDGVNSLDSTLAVLVNSPTNFARATGSVSLPPVNLITGTAEANSLLGTNFVDRIDALAGNDTLDGLGGNDSLNGGEGRDTAVFHGTRAAFTIGNGGGTVSGPDGNDTLSSIERLRFDDLTTEFLPGGAAAQSVKLLSAVFGSAFVKNREFIGIGVSVFDAGTSYLNVADLALRAKLGPTPSDTLLVQTLYTNLVGSAPDAATTASFVALITSGQFTQASLTIFAADHPLNLALVDLVGQAAQGIDYVPVVG